MKRPVCIYCFIFGIVCLLSQLFFIVYEEHGEQYDNQEVSVIGSIQKIHYSDQKQILFLSDIQSVQQNPNHLPRTIICYLDQKSLLKIGNLVEVSGLYSTFDISRNPYSFNEREYYLSRKIDARLFQAKILKKSESYHFVQNSLQVYREKCKAMFEKYMGVRYASILSAMLLGYSSEIDPTIMERFQNQGISHILCISGLHISLIGLGLFKMLQKFRVPIQFGASISIVVICLYAFMVEGSTSVFRACIMFFIYLGAILLKRSYDSLTAVCIAGVFLLLDQPRSFMRADFLLSFGAVIGICIFYPVVKELIKIKWKILQCLQISICVFVMTLPIQLNFFYEYSIFNFATNLLVVPLVGVVLIIGSVAFLIGSICEPLAIPLLWIIKLIYFYFEKICNMFDLFPVGNMVIGKPNIVQVVMYYLFLLGALIYIQRRYRDDIIRNQKDKLIVALCVCLAMITIHAQIPQKSRFTMLDIGQGDCMALVMKDNSCFLFDAGSEKESGGRYIVEPFLKGQGIDRVNGIFISHSDEDHTIIIKELLERSAISKIRYENMYLAKRCMKDEKFMELIQIAKRAKCNVHFVDENQDFYKENLEISVLYARGQERADNANDSSMILDLSIQGVRLLLAGDLSSPYEDAIIYKNHKTFDVLKVSHHGSKYSTSKLFLNTIHVKNAILSAGRKNRFHHPHKETLDTLSEAGIAVHTTINHGAISIWFDEVSEGSGKYDGKPKYIIEYEID